MALGLAWALTRLAGGACARMANRCDTEMCGCVERGAARIEASASRADEYFKRLAKRNRKLLYAKAHHVKNSLLAYFARWQGYVVLVQRQREHRVAQLGLVVAVEARR